jgi:hypothetical protein
MISGACAASTCITPTTRSTAPPTARALNAVGGRAPSTPRIVSTTPCERQLTLERGAGGFAGWSFQPGADSGWRRGGYVAKTTCGGCRAYRQMMAARRRGALTATQQTHERNRLAWENFLPKSHRTAVLADAERRIRLLPPARVPAPDGWQEKGSPMWEILAAQVRGLGHPSPPCCPLCALSILVRGNRSASSVAYFSIDVANDCPMCC